MSRLIYTIAFIVTLAIGTYLRFFVGALGHNFDLESYVIVGEIYNAGESVYEFTTRYNYAPFWFHVIGTLHMVASTLNPTTVVTTLALLITSLLTIADIAIALIIRKLHGTLIGALFILNPISIIISGYHRQFDNVAILVGLLGVVVYQHVKIRNRNMKFLLFAACVGCSLVIKHVLILYPLWLLMSSKNNTQRIVSIAIPYGIFFLSFIPYYSHKDAIIKNVFLYSSYNNAPLYNMIVPKFAHSFFTPTLFFITAIIVIGYIVRKQTLLNLFYIYLLSLVLFSPALTNQYLVIPIVALIAFPSMVSLFYIAVGALYLIGDYDGLRVNAIFSFFPEYFNRNLYGHFPYLILSTILLACFMRILWGIHKRSSEKIPVY